MSNEEIGGGSGDAIPQRAEIASPKRGKPGKKVSANASRGRKEKKALRVGPLEEKLKEYSDLLASERVNHARLRTAFGSLAASFGASGPAAEGSVRAAFTASMDETEQARLLLELSMSPEAVVTSTGASLTWMSTHSLWPLYARIFASRWITARDLESDVTNSQVRKAAFADVLDPPSESHPLLRADSDGTWTPGNRETQGGEWKAMSTLDIGDGTLPLSREVKARRELLELALLSRQALRKEIEGRKEGLAVLERAIRIQIKMLEDGVTQHLVAWNGAMHLLSIVGRNPEIWVALQHERDRLLDTTGASTDALTDSRWAEAVAASWASTPKSEHRLQAISSPKLGALLRAGRDLAAPTLVRKAREVLMLRSSGGADDEELWQTLAQLPESVPGEAAWAKAALMERQRAAHQDASIDAARTWPVERLRTDEFAQLVETVPATNALIALSLAHGRIQEEHSQHEHRQVELYASKIRLSLQKVDSAADRLTTLFGKLPSGLAGVIADVRARIAELVRKMSDHDAEQQNAQSRSRGVSEEREVSLIEALKSLEFDPQRSAAAALALRDRVRERLTEVGETDASSLSEVGLRLHELPPEAVGLVWEIGVTMNVGTLLAGVPELLATVPWSHRIWSDVILRFANLAPSAIQVDETVAKRTVMELLPAVQKPELQSGAFVRMTRLFNQAVGALDELSAAISDVTKQLEEVKTSLSHGER